jgi:hypothetical protein
MTGAGEESRTLDLNLGKVALYQLSYSRVAGTCDYLRFSTAFQDNLLPRPQRPTNSGAGEESRTLDLNLGKVALYQLSYSRFVSFAAMSSQQAGIIEMLSYVSRMTQQKLIPYPIFP